MNMLVIATIPVKLTQPKAGWLTVEAPLFNIGWSEPVAHEGQAWELFEDLVIQITGEHPDNIFTEGEQTRLTDQIHRAAGI